MASESKSVVSRFDFDSSPNYCGYCNSWGSLSQVNITRLDYSTFWILRVLFSRNWELKTTRNSLTEAGEEVEDMCTSQAWRRHVVLSTPSDVMPTNFNQLNPRERQSNKSITSSIMEKRIQPRKIQAPMLMLMIQIRKKRLKRRVKNTSTKPSLAINS